ncbi:pseudouridine synthase [Nemania serpens]|nr:pseudouridine synthase [Nemania serpens]
MRTAGGGDTAATSQERAVEEGPNTQVEEQPKDSIVESDKNALVDLVGQTTAESLTIFYAKIQQNSKAAPKTYGHVSIPTIDDKAQRSRVHGEIRRIFGGKIETATGSDGAIKATAAGGGNKQRGNRSANAGIRNAGKNLAQGHGGPYLHFSLYKENKDTMDALNHMAKTLRVHPKAFGAAGTKDRRAVTVQRVSIKGRSPASLLFVNERISNLKIGDFEYAQDPIRLNDHDGNEFVIVLKNCVFNGTEHLSFEEKLSVAKSTVDSALTHITQRGFINYYGTQRFGTHQIGTQEIGMKILQEDFAGAIQALLSYDPLLLQDSQDKDHIKGVHREDISRAQACSAFFKTKNAKAALEYLPPRCHVEKTVIQHLDRNPTDYVGALMSINRSMRTMYGHAYQSLVWNFVASKRWERFGAQVINGDLVLVKSKSAAALRMNDEEKQTEDSLVWGEDIAAAHNSYFVPHAVTEDDLQDRKFSIYDIVLPSPGWDVVYPPNEIGDFYAEFMGKPENGGLDPHNMRRRQRDFSLPGSYRKLIGKLKKVPTASVQAYSSDLEQLVPTDLDIIRSRKAKETAELDASQRSTAASWQTFTQNVLRNEVEESRSRVTRRESEEPTPSARINDTWVQTSVDGSNKRIRISKSTTASANRAEAIVADGGDAMRIEDITQDDKLPEFGTDTDMTNQQQDKIDVAQDRCLVHQSLGLGSSIVRAIISQVRAIKDRFLNAIHQAVSFLRMATNRISAKPTHQEPQLKPYEALPQPESTNDEATTTAETDPPTLQTTSNYNAPPLDANPGPNEVSARPRLSDDNDNPTSIAATGKAEPTETGATVTADSTEAKKIAVVVRFASKQYLCLELRWLVFK